MMYPKLDIEEIRETLTPFEESIIFSLFERARFKINLNSYQPGGLFDFLLRGTEELHSRAGRYDDLRERPYTDDLPRPIIKREDKVSPVLALGVNRNPEIMLAYFTALRDLCESGDDGEHGSSAERDVWCLQNISTRVHHGVFVAEWKFQQAPKEYVQAVMSRDWEALTTLLRNEKVEERILASVLKKAEAYHVNPSLVHNFYKQVVIPTTIKVEEDYIVRRVAEADLGNHPIERATTGIFREPARVSGIGFGS